MSTELPKTHESSGDSDTNSDSENSSTSDTTGSDWECSGTKQNSARKAHFSVTSCDTGLKLKIAAIPLRKVSPRKNSKQSVKKKVDDIPSKNKLAPDRTPVRKKKSQLSESSSSSASCSKCSSGSSSDDDIPLKAVSKLLPAKCSPQKTQLKNANNSIKSSDEEQRFSDDVKDNAPKANSKDKQSASKATNVVKKTKSDDTNDTTVKRPRGRPRTKFSSPAAESAACGSSTSSSTSSSSSSSSSASSSSSDSDSADAAGGSVHASADDSSAALVAACQLQVIDDADLAELFPEQTSSAPAQQPNFSTFSVHNTSPDNDDKSIVDNGDGSSSEMELTPQLVTAAIQRATADSSGSENECSNSDAGHQNTTHYASSLLQQFVAQTQLLSSTTPLTPITPATTSLACGLNNNAIDGVGTISDCVLSQINNLPEITPIAPNFLNTSQHLSPQQTEELTQINKDLEEITSVTDSVSISIPNPPSLEDCVDNNDFMNLDITQGSSELGSANDLLKNSPLVSADMNTLGQIDSQKFDTISTNSIESQEDVKNVVVESRRKRGRPRKVRVPIENKNLESQKDDKCAVNVINDFHNANDPPNVSPDSGILSNHNSPTHSPLRRHDVEEAQNRISRKSVQKENNTRERRNMRSKSTTRSKTQIRSDSSDCDYQKKRIENEIKQIKTEAPSPIPLKHEQNKFDKTKKNDHKLDIAALDRMLYATDRVLYPPRKKVGRKPQSKSKSTKSAPKTLKDKNQYDSGDSDDESLPSNRSVLSGVYAKRKELNSKLANIPKKTSKTFTNTWRDHQSENEAAADDPLDPTWKLIDLNPKYKDILSGYKSDHEFKPYKSCSRLIESGYKSDYGCRSGYKSDYHRSGYKSDYKSGYKSDKSGYKTDYSVRSMRRRMRKLKKTRSVRDRSYYKNQKHFVSDQEILLLTNKTFNSLTLGNSSSDSECESYLGKPNTSPKYVSVCTKYPLPSKYNFGFSKINQKHVLRLNSSDPFAPGPVFSGLQRPLMNCNIFKLSHNNNNTLVKSPTKANSIGKPLPALKPVFTHKFGASPITTTAKQSRREIENNSKYFTGTVSPKSRKQGKSNSNSQSNAMKKENSPKPLPSIFEKAKNSYIPNKSLSRNVFLNFKKPHIKPSFHVKKHRRTVVLAPPKINLKPIERPSRVTVKTESKHHRHRSKRRHRSRSVSRCRETKTIDLIDQKFSQDMDNLITNFIKLCQVAPKLITNVSQNQQKNSEKPAVEAPPTKVVKRGSKKRKTTDNQEIITPTSKRRHKKQLAESQNKGGKDTNEHKLPLKKRHYHINSSTSNSLSLSLVTGEFDENSKNGASPEKFLCTETDCMEMQNNVSDESPKPKPTHEKIKKGVENTKSVIPGNNTQEIKITNIETTIKISKPEVNVVTETLDIKIDASNTTPTKNLSPNSLTATDDELAIKKPASDQSDLSKKIYETSEKLKAVHKMVHDLEKSLPKSKEDAKSDTSKLDAQKGASPRSENKISPMRNSAPIVTPKKRHRLEADKVTPLSSLDQVVQSLSKKLSEDKSTNSSTTKDTNQNNSKEEVKEFEKTDVVASNSTPANNNTIDPLKSMSARTLYKSSIPPAQKSEIMTRKKNRLEGLTSNLVSKINPSAATKVLDTLLNNNIRKSIESRILEKEKNSGVEASTKSTDDKNKNKEFSQVSTRATVIKSPVSKGKILETKKSKVPESTTTQTIVVNVDKPTGIFEPSVDLEDQIPKSSICINNASNETSKTKSKIKGSDSKNTNALLSAIDTESEIPLALISETPDPIIRPKRGESIASVLSDKIQETTGGHNLRQPKRNLSKERDNESDDTTDKKKKKSSTNIIRESKLVLPTKMLIPKIQAERLPISDTTKKINVPGKKQEASDASDSKNSVDISKKKTRRRKAINRTGFPSVKRKKKKIECNSQNITSDSHLTSEDTDNNSAFERVPKDGEAMSSFLQRTISKKPELKVVLNKEECPKQGRLTVVALEKLQGKEIPFDDKTTNKTEANDKKNTNSSILRAPSLQLKQGKSDKDAKSHVNKWEVLSETDSIPSLASSISNDPEDSIPLSLLNLKADRPGSRLDNLERLKRKTRAMSPSQEIEEILSKRKIVEKTTKVGLRPKSSLAVLCPTERRFTRSSDIANEDPKRKNKKSDNKKSVNEITEKPSKPASLVTRRKSRLCQANKKIPEVHSSSRESSLDTVVSRKLGCKSREPSVDTLRDHDENDPLPLNEKEIDFEKSIDVLSKSIICKKRVACSRDDSPASSVDNRDKPVVSKRNPRLRKKFLVAGLFSDYYKEDPKPEGKGKNLVTQTEFPPGLLAPPPYCERWVRRRLQHFTLPYDIWWQQHYNQPVPSWNYKKIRTNVYYDVKPSAEECESVACNCVPSSGCNEDCINRLVFSECSPQLCPCGDRCKNQRIQRHEWASGLEKFMTENKGWGVRTKHKITSGDFILEYVGEVVSDKEFKERMATRYARDTHHYCLHLDGGLVIDGHRMGGDGRFVNHSCRPNCEMQKWTANGTFRMALFALRDIEPDEELTYDYNFSLFNPAVGQPCKCDSEDCRGVIGGKSQRITKLPVKTASRTPSNASNQSNGSNGNQPRVGRPRKAVKCNKKSEQPSVTACDIKNMTILKYQQHLNKLYQEPQMKPLTAKERNLVKERHCFLFRNLENVRRIRDRLSISMPPSPPAACPVPVPAPAAAPAPVPSPAPTPAAVSSSIVNPLALPDTMNPQVFLKRLQALRAPKEDTAKKLVRLEDDPTATKNDRLIKVFKAIYGAVVAAKDEKDKLLCAPLLKLKSDRGKAQDGQPVMPDLSSIEANLDSGQYETVAQFDGDMNAAFSAVMREHGRLSTLGTIAIQAKKVYNSAKSDYAEYLTKILGPEEPLPAGFLQKTKTEEVIMCICGLHVEEGLMVQCGGARCGVWQHARCMRVADTRAPHYCHHCAPATTKVNREIPLDDYTEEGHQFYLSLMRGDLQVRQGDTVYVLRDIPIDDKHPDVSLKTGDKAESPKTKRQDRKKVKNIAKGKDKTEDTGQNKGGEVRKHTYQTIGEIPVSELDIFRVERLWKHKDTQERYVYGHHYLRPHETFHEPTRKFFHNEVMRVPLYEAVPIELVMSQCWVMDLNTYCKGRPVGAAEAHVYICELRVDRTARLFTKISRPKYPICTKAYAFDHFPQRLKITRTYAPHEVSPEYLKGRAAKSTAPTEKSNKGTSAKETKKKPPAITYSDAAKTAQCEGGRAGAEASARREQQKERVNSIARRLLARFAGPRSALDASYLLAPRRPRARAS